MDISSKQPDFVSDTGVKWYFDTHTTEYARRDVSKLVSLKSSGKGIATIRCYVVVFPSGETTRVVLDNDTPIYESTSLDAIGCFLDMLKLSLQH